MKIDDEVEEEPVTVNDRRKSRRLSFTMNVDVDDNTSSARYSENSEGHNSQSRSRRSTMSHPLAALKEAHYRATQIEFVANLEKAAGEGLEEVEMTAIRTVRRASVVLGFSNEETEARPSGSEAGEG